MKKSHTSRMRELETKQEELSECIIELANSIKEVAVSQKGLITSIEELKKNNASPLQSPLSPDINYYR